MALLINDKWQIVMDRYNYILQKKCVKQNKETGENEVTWSSVAYCRDLEHCCNYFMERHIKTAVDWQDYLNKIAEVNKDTLIDMLYNIFGEEKVKTHNIIGIKFELVGDCK